MQSNTFVPLPWGGQLVSLTSQGKFLGWGRNQGENVKVVTDLNDNEKFIVELDGHLYAFRQQVSNLYIGGDISEGAECVFASAKKSAEQFFLENTGVGNVRIRSARNTYLCVQGNILKWRSDPGNAPEGLWRINVIQNNYQK